MTWTISAVLLASLVGIAILRFGSLSLALAYLRGDRLLILPSVADLGPGRTGEKRVLEFEIVNLGGQDTKLVGGTTHCTCVATNGLPLTVPASSSRRIEVEVTIRRRDDDLISEVFVIHTDSSLHPMLVGKISGKLLPSSTSEDGI